ncbi:MULTISPECIES: DHA2 family efflux MFS transporter permease subunit [unclassified Aeromicrobium]|uniref:DHA2 family efflux MFS transporter permease subunit n=1 Tax=unclassified Aeromicrobium TaxID=2633570 RepID=UPI000A673E47|nr:MULTISPECIES: DHA2 family efflux MFS transporter permease subunit [unclassified Aeromicrobium]
MRLDSAAGRWLVAAMVLGTGMAFLDGSIVTLALPAVDDDLQAGVAGLQWTVNAYTLALASLILVGGSLGDRYGRRRVFVVGVVWFGAASVLCAVAPTIEVLVAARGLQGVGGALLTPGSLAIISASIRPEDRGRAIGLWSGLAGVTTALGPLVGGTLVDAVGWRSVFWINVPLAVAVVWVTLRHVPESRGAQTRLDVEGAALTVGTLAFLTYGLVEQTSWPALVGVVLLVAFVVHQARSPHALVPLSLFADRVFTAANICTFAIYAALSGTMFLLVLQLQYVAGYTPLEAGLATLPLTVLMLLLSSRAGAFGQRVGPRIPMTVGPLVSAAGLLLLLRVGADARFWVDVLPGATLLGLGITLLVAPLTTAVLAAAPDEQAGIASGINNAVSRTAGLLAVAAIPPLAGIAGADFASPDVFGPGFRAGTLMCVGLLVVASVCAAALVHGRSADPERAPTTS